MSRRRPKPIFSHRDPKSPAAPLQLQKWSRLCSFGLPVREESAEALNRPALVQSADTSPLYLLLLKPRSGVQQREGRGRCGGGFSALKPSNKNVWKKKIKEVLTRIIQGSTLVAGDAAAWSHRVPHQFENELAHLLLMQAAIHHALFNDWKTYWKPLAVCRLPPSNTWGSCKALIDERQRFHWRVF